MNFKCFKVAILSSVFFLILYSWYLSPILKPFPIPTGVYTIGTVSYAIDNNCMLRCWYPAETSSEYKSIAYGHSEQNAWTINHIAQASYIPNFLLKNGFNLTTSSKLNTPLSKKEQTYPIVIFLPGFGSSYDYYEALLSGLASHGYIIMALNTKSVQLVSFPDGKFFTPDQNDWDSKVPLVIHYALNAIDWITKVHIDQHNFWHNRINLEKLYILGHSLGGSAAMIIAQQDKRVVAGINLDGWLQMKKIKAIPIPFLFLLNDTTFPPGKKDGLQEIQQTCVLSGSSCNIKIIPGAGHNSFFDLAFLKWPLSKFGNAATKDPYKVLQNIEYEILNFLNK